MKLGKLKNFAVGFFPFLTLTALMGSVTPPAIGVCVALAFVYAFYKGKIDNGKKPGLIPTCGMVVYWAVIAAIIAVAGRALFDYYAVPLAVLAVIFAVPLALRRSSAVFSIGAMANVCALLLFLMFSPPGITMNMLDKLENEQYAAPVYLLPDETMIADDRPATPYQGVRSIITDKNETTIYFTVDHAPPGVTDPFRFESIYRIDLGDPSNVKAFRGNRVFGLALTPDETKLLATSYYERKLLIMDPETLAVLDTRPTSTYPQFILVDEPGARVTVTHEGLGIATIYSLPDVKYYKKTKLGTAPAAIAVDRQRRVFYAANWISWYVLSEVEFYSHRVRRRKFLFPPASGGISIDTVRNRIYLTLGLSGTIVGIDRDSFETVDRIKTKTMVRPVCVDSKRKLIYAGNMKEPYVSVFDFDGKLAGKIFTGSQCRVFYITPKSNRVLAGTILGVIELKTDNLVAERRSRISRVYSGRSRFSPSR